MDVVNLLNKDTLREIVRTFSRYLSIIIIVALGVFVFVGLIVTGSIMRYTIDKVVDRQNIEDILIKSPLGFEDEDIKIIESQDDISELEYGYDTDLSVKGKNLLINVSSMPYKIDMPIIVKGRVVNGNREIILNEKLEEKGISIGDTIHFQREINKFSMEDDKKPYLKDYDYVVTGFFKSANYASNQDSKGQSNRGLGDIKGLAYINSDEFDIDVTTAKIKFKDTVGLLTSSNKYKKAVESHRNSLEIDFKYRPDNRLEDLKSDISDEIFKGEDKIADAKEKLSDAKTKLEDGRKKLEEGKSEYKKGRAEFDSETSKAKDKLDDAKNKLYKSEQDIKKGETELAEGYDKLVEGKNELDDAKREIADGEEKYISGKAEYDEGLGKLKASETQLIEGEQQLIEGRKKLDDGWKKIEESKLKLEEGKKELSENEKKLIYAEKELNDGIKKLADSVGLNTTDLSQIREKIYSLDAALGQAKQVVDGYNQVITGISTAQENITTLNAQKVQIEEGIAQIVLALEDPSLTEEQKAELNAKKAVLEQNLAQVIAGIETATQMLTSLEGKKVELEAAISKINAQLPAGTDILKDYDTLKAQIGLAKAGILKIEESKGKLETAKIKLEAGKEKLAEGEKQLFSGIEQANKGEQEYFENKNKLEDGKRKYIEGKQKLDDAKVKLDDAKIKLEDGKKEYEDGKKKYDENYAKYIEGKSDLENGRERFKDGKKDYEEGLKNYNDEIKKGQDKLNNAKSKLYKSEVDLKKGEREFIDKSKEADEKIFDGEKKISDAKRILKILKRPSYSITPRTSNFDLNMYLDFSRRVDKLSYIFPVFFFLISMLVSFNTMTRMVEDNRTIIGTYKALGYTEREISKKFFNYGASASILGGSIGAVLGSYILPMIIGGAYYAGSVFENEIIYKIYPFRILLSIITGLLFTAVAAKISVNASLRENTASLLRVKPPKNGNRILFERLTFIWSKLDFLQKVTARNLFRYKKRMVMTIIGIMGCTALLVLGFGIKGSVRGIANIQFDEVLKYNLSVIYDRDIDENSYDEYRRFVDKNNIESGQFYQENLKIEYKGTNQAVLLTVPSSDKVYDKYFSIRDRVTKEPIELSDNGVVVSEKFAKIFNLKVGDILKLNDDEDREYKMMVSGICEMYTGHYIFMNIEYYEKIFGREYAPNSDLMNLKMNNDEIDKLSSEFSSYKSVISVMDLSVVKNLMDRFMYSISKVEVVITVASSLLAMVVLYNLTNINIEERLREISTIKVLGFYARETTQYIYRETWILTVIGIVIGLFVGKALHYGVLQVVPPDQAMLSPKLLVSSYIIASMITVIVSILIMVIFHEKLKNIDMIESLKSNE